jgi:hypothetical protein
MWWKDRFGDTDLSWKVEEILEHKFYKEKDGSNDIKFKVKFYAGDKNWFNMNDLRLHDPIKVFIYGKEHGLLEEEPFSWTKEFAPDIEEYEFLLHCYKMATTTGDFYKFGELVPRSVKQALEYDAKNGNNKWRDALITEIGQINYYETFRMIAHGVPLPGYK